MKYVITLGHDKFCLYLDILRRAKEEGLISWSAAHDLCDCTVVVPDEE